MTSTLVLVVDDEPAMLKVNEMTLIGAGFEVLTFDDPRDALNEIREGLRPDVVVSDVNMPPMDGFDFYEMVRRVPELRSVPFLFLTALEDRASMRKGMTLGADDYLTKPVQRDELIEAVEVRLRRVEELRHPLTGIVAVDGFGHPMVQRDGERLDWDSLKALELLFYLLENRSGATTYEVAEALWPGKTESKASSSFHTTLYRLRKVMGGDLVEAANRRYYLHDGLSVEYDVDKYRQLAERARDTRAVRDYERAVRLYVGHFLTGFESAWVEELRTGLQDSHLALLEEAAEQATEEDDLPSATQFYQLLTEHEPYSEVGWEGLADSWEARGDQQRADEARARFQQLMEDED